MLVVTGGVERTEVEYAALFIAAGLRLERVISTGQPIQFLRQANFESLGVCRRAAVAIGT